MPETPDDLSDITDPNLLAQIDQAKLDQEADTAQILADRATLDAAFTAIGFDPDAAALIIDAVAGEAP